tara:strand:- start:594 stop:1880 length:1287 start_codon:yes stop_codon:yes gene_type:complete
MADYVAPGNHTLTDVIIVNDNQQHSVSIRGLVASLTLTEKMDAKATVASMSISDGINLMGNFPILGHERVVVMWSTDSLTGLESELRIEHFRMTSIENLSIGEGKPTASYRISMVSEYAYHQAFNEVKQAFSHTISDAVKIIHEAGKKPVHGKALLPTYDLKVDNTSNIIDFILHDTPMTCIDVLTAWAFSAEYDSSSYFYFQNKDGYNFRSIESIAKEWRDKPADDPDVLVRKYTQGYDSTSIDSNAMYTISNIQNFVRNSSLQLAGSGALNNDVAELDYVYKQNNVSNYQYKPGDFGFLDTTALFDEDFISGYGGEATEKHWVYRDGSVRTFSTAQALHKKWSAHKLLYSNMVGIEIPGNSELTAGDVLDISIPIQDSRMNDEDRPLDRFLSGKFIAQEIIHKFTPATYYIQANLFRMGAIEDPNG